MNYYNEIDPFAATWIQAMIYEKQIPPGEVDTRSIEDVTPNELKSYTQCHFFAGIAGWSYALKLAGVPETTKLWTGSCPCQPFSAAGKGAGFADERHLWPAWFWLIKQCQPELVFGEQVAGKAGETWLDVVQTDLEGEGYTCGAAVTAACGFGAPHQRKRLYWLGELGNTKSRRRGETISKNGLSSLAHPDNKRLNREQLLLRKEQNKNTETTGSSETCGMGNASSQGLEGSELTRESTDPQLQTIKRAGPTGGYWEDCDWLPCRDGKSRCVEPGTFPLAHGVPARVGRLRGYGNAIVPQVAAAFIHAYLDTVTR